MTHESRAVTFAKGESEATGMGLGRLWEGHKIKEQRCVSLQSLTWDSVTWNRTQKCNKGK